MILFLLVLHRTDYFLALLKIAVLCLTGFSLHNFERFYASAIFVKMISSNVQLSCNYNF